MQTTFDSNYLPLKNQIGRYFAIFMNNLPPTKERKLASATDTK